MAIGLMGGGVLALLLAAPASAQVALPAPTPIALPAPSPIALPAPTPIALPAPGQQPQAIDFTADPLLRFLAAESPAEAFRAAIADAVARHPAVGEAEAGVAAARAGRREVRAGLLPGFSASIVASRSVARDFEGNSAIVEGLLPRGRTDAQVGADQLLFDFGATGGRVAGASARLRAARAETARAATATALAAVEAWYQVLGFQCGLDLADALTARHRAILLDTRARVAAGLGAGGDIARAEAGLADAIGAGARQARQLAAVRARYHELFGMAAPARPARAAAPVSVAGDAAAAVGMSHSAPAVVTALALAEAARAEARAVRSEALPRLSAGVSAVRYDAFGNGSNYDVRGQIVLRQSLTMGGAEAARTDAAQARARAAGFASDRVAAEAGRDAEAAFADTRILADAVATLGDAYRANRRSRDTVAEQVRLSRGSLTELLLAEERYFAAAQALLLGSIERDLASYTLMARTGELLRLFSIDPDRHEKG